MYIASWSEYYCQSCGKRNFINHGDCTDLTLPEATGYECWNCGEIEELEEAENILEEEAPFIVEGKRILL